MTGRASSCNEEVMGVVRLLKGGGAGGGRWSGRGPVASWRMTGSASCNEERWTFSQCKPGGFRA